MLHGIELEVVATGHNYVGNNCTGHTCTGHNFLTCTAVRWKLLLSARIIQAITTWAVTVQTITT